MSNQFGLTINVRYKNPEGVLFMSTLFNDTISVVEPDESLDGETFFLYIFLAAIVVLVAILVQHLVSKKRRSKPHSSHHHKHKQTNGNSSNKDYDESWIPKEHFSGKEDKSPRVSPRQRRNGNGIPSSGNSSNDE